MKKIINSGLLLTSLLGYLEWGEQNSTFLFLVEWDLFANISSKSASFLHPFIIIPLLGQLLLLITLFQKKPSKVLGILGVVCLGAIMYFLFFIGFLSFNIKIILFSLPFVLMSFLFLWFNKKKK